MSIKNLYIVVVVLTASKDAKFWCENGNLSRVMTGTLTIMSSGVLDPAVAYLSPLLHGIAREMRNYCLRI